MFDGAFPHEPSNFNENPPIQVVQVDPLVHTAQFIGHETQLLSVILGFVRTIVYLGKQVVQIMLLKQDAQFIEHAIQTLFD